MSTAALYRVPQYSPVRPDSPISLTRRGRVLLRLAAFASIFILAAALFGARAESALAGREAPPAYQTITVAPGETLWQIAKLVSATTGATGDLRDLIDQIIALNALTSPSITAGQHLRIPVSK